MGWEPLHGVAFPVVLECSSGVVGVVSSEASRRTMSHNRTRDSLSTVPSRAVDHVHHEPRDPVAIIRVDVLSNPWMGAVDRKTSSLLVCVLLEECQECRLVEEGLD